MYPVTIPHFVCTAADAMLSPMPTAAVNHIAENARECAVSKSTMPETVTLHTNFNSSAGRNSALSMSALFGPGAHRSLPHLSSAYAPGSTTQSQQAPHVYTTDASLQHRQQMHEHGSQVPYKRCSEAEAAVAMLNLQSGAGVAQ